MTQLKEAGTLTTKGGEFMIRVITPGKGSSGFYPSETIEAAGRDRVFHAGLPMFIDHASPSESMDRPEGTLHNLAGVLTEDAHWDGEGLVAKAKVFEHWKPILADMHEHIGVSIRASGEVSESENGPTITRLCESQSVDFVTQAGRGGKVLEVLESKRDPVALIEEVATALTPPVADETSQPRLVENKETNMKEEPVMGDTNTGRVDEATAPPFQKDGGGKSADALQAENERLKAQISTLQAELAKLKQGGKKQEAANIYADAFREAGVDAPTLITALSESAAAGDDDLDVAALTEAAKTQAAEVAAAQGAGTPKGLGESHPIDATESKRTSEDIINALEGN